MDHRPSRQRARASMGHRDDNGRRRLVPHWSVDQGDWRIDQDVRWIRLTRVTAHVHQPHLAGPGSFFAAMCDRLQISAARAGLWGRTVVESRNPLPRRTHHRAFGHPAARHNGRDSSLTCRKSVVWRRGAFAGCRTHGIVIRPKDGSLSRGTCARRINGDTARAVKLSHTASADYVPCQVGHGASGERKARRCDRERENETMEKR